MKRVISLFLSVCMLLALSSAQMSYAEQSKAIENKIRILSPVKPVKNFFKRVNERVLKKLCRQVDKVETDTEKEINEFLKPIVDGMGGFKYDPEKDIYYTREDSLQKYFGFGDLYDKMGPVLGMKIDELPIVFNYKHKKAPEKEWLIEFWKGQYGGGLSIGGEIGAYNRTVEEGMEEYVPGSCNYKVFFDSAKGKEKMYLSYVICDKLGNTLLARNSAEYAKPEGEPKDKDWWLLGIKLGKYSKSEDLVMKCGIIFLSEEMAQKFVEAARQQHPQAIKDLRQEDRGVTFTWCK